MHAYTRENIRRIIKSRTNPLGAEEEADEGKKGERGVYSLEPEEETGFPFERVYVINLDKRTDRWKHIQTQLKKAGIPEKLIKRFSAVNGNKVDLEYLKQSGGREEGKVPMLTSYAYNSLTAKTPDELVFGHDLTPGALGCALSHIKIWREIVSEGISRALVLEDDAHFAKNFKQKLNIRLSHVPSDWGIVYLSHINVKGGVFWHPEQGFVGKGVQFANSDTRTTVAYMLNTQAAGRLLEVTIPLSFQVDTHMTSYVATEKLNSAPGARPPLHINPNKVEEVVVDPKSYVLEPPLAVQLRNYGSDVQTSDMHSTGYEEFMLSRLRDAEDMEILHKSKILGHGTDCQAGTKISFNGHRGTILELSPDVSDTMKPRKRNNPMSAVVEWEEETSYSLLPISELHCS